MKTVRVLVVEDHEAAADDLKDKLLAIGKKLGCVVLVSVILEDDLEGFQRRFSARYPHGAAFGPDAQFDITSLDVIFKQHENVGGVQLFQWLTEQGIAEHLGKIIVRSHSDSRAIGRGITRVSKSTLQEIDDWTVLLENVLDGKHT